MANFLDTLTDKQRALVAKTSKGNARPRYYDSARANVQAQATRTGQDPTAFDPSVQIGLDFEAVLILCRPDAKQQLVAFIDAALASSVFADEDDLALFAEVVDQRAANFAQATADTGAPLARLDTARSTLMGVVGGSDVADVSAFFALLAQDQSSYAALDALATHDRIADQGVVYAYSASSADRVRELLSWRAVVATYL